MKIIIIFYLLISNFISVTNFKCESNDVDKSDKKKSYGISNFDKKITGYFNADNLEDYIVKNKKRRKKLHSQFL